VGLTRAKRQVKVTFAQNRRNRGLWQAAAPSRFIDELPEENVEVIEAKSPYGGSPGGAGRFNPYGRSRFE
jgi:DNA helicase-2/ATP-dependent DNA helicase PcrA